MIARRFMLGAVLGFALQLSAAPAGKAGFDSVVSVFFKANCVKCHGPEKAKGKVTLHNLDGDLGGGKALEHSVLRCAVSCAVLSARDPS